MEEMKFIYHLQLRVSKMESSEIEDMSIQALVEGAVSGVLKGVKTGEGLKGPKPRIIGKNFNPFSLIVLADLSTIET